MVIAESHRTKGDDYHEYCTSLILPNLISSHLIYSTLLYSTDHLDAARLAHMSLAMQRIMREHGIAALPGNSVCVCVCVCVCDVAG